MDLQFLNKFIWVPKFCMKSAKSVIACLKQRGIFWHQLSLQFRLSSAPRVLTEILTLLLGLMRTQDVYVAWFLDDLLLKDSSAGLKAMNFSANIQRMIPYLQLVSKICPPVLILSWHNPSQNFPFFRKYCLFRVPHVDPQIQMEPLSSLLHEGSRHNGSILWSSFFWQVLPMVFTLWTVLCICPARQISPWHGDIATWGVKKSFLPMP